MFQTFNHSTLIQNLKFEIKNYDSETLSFLKFYYLNTLLDRQQHQSETNQPDRRYFLNDDRLRDVLAHDLGKPPREEYGRNKKEDVLQTLSCQSNGRAGE